MLYECRIELKWKIIKAHIEIYTENQPKNEKNFQFDSPERTWTKMKKKTIKESLYPSIHPSIQSDIICWLFSLIFSVETKDSSSFFSFPVFTNFHHHHHQCLNELATVWQDLNEEKKTNNSSSSSIHSNGIIIIMIILILSKPQIQQQQRKKNLTFYYSIWIILFSIRFYYHHSHTFRNWSHQNKKRTHTIRLQRTKKNEWKIKIKLKLNQWK